MRMEVKVEIVKGDTIKNIHQSCESSLQSLMNSIKLIKESTNNYLTEMVNLENGTGGNVNVIKEGEDGVGDDDESDDDGDEEDKDSSKIKNISTTTEHQSDKSSKNSKRRKLLKDV